MKQLEVIPEEIWDKIKEDKRNARMWRAVELQRVIQFCTENKEYSYVIGKGSRPKHTKKKPIVRRLNETEAS